MRFECIYYDRINLDIKCIIEMRYTVQHNTIKFNIGLWYKYEINLDIYTYLNFQVKLENRPKISRGFYRAKVCHPLVTCNFPEIRT